MDAGKGEGKGLGPREIPGRRAAAAAPGALAPCVRRPERAAARGNDCVARLAGAAAFSAASSAAFCCCPERAGQERCSPSASSCSSELPPPPRLTAGSRDYFACLRRQETQGSLPLDEEKDDLFYRSALLPVLPPAFHAKWSPPHPLPSRTGHGVPSLTLFGRRLFISSAALSCCARVARGSSSLRRPRRLAARSSHASGLLRRVSR
ncbi:uncharacterized protein LOC144145790 [Haemaphysalis longicornis]